MKKLFLTLIFLNSLSSAYTFDIWESKITLDEAIQIAKVNNIPLCKDGVVATGKEFKQNYLYLQKYPNNRVFNYRTTLLNQYAIVYLYFTKDEKKLYKLKVRWVRPNKDLVNSLYILLDKKYGKKEILLSNMGAFLLSTQRQWKENNTTLIQTKTSLSGTTLLYIDINETKKEKSFKQKVSQEKKEKALIKDANKF